MTDPSQKTVPSLRATARALAESLASLSEGISGSMHWRLRVAAAEARAIDDLLSEEREVYCAERAE